MDSHTLAIFHLAHTTFATFLSTSAQWPRTVVVDNPKYCIIYPLGVPHLSSDGHRHIYVFIRKWPVRRTDEHLGMFAVEYPLLSLVHGEWFVMPGALCFWGFNTY